MFLGQNHTYLLLNLIRTERVMIAKLLKSFVYWPDIEPYFKKIKTSPSKYRLGVHASSFCSDHSPLDHRTLPLPSAPILRSSASPTHPTPPPLPSRGRTKRRLINVLVQLPDQHTEGFCPRNLGEGKGPRILTCTQDRKKDPRVRDWTPFLQVFNKMLQISQLNCNYFTWSCKLAGLHV